MIRSIIFALFLTQASPVNAEGWAALERCEGVLNRCFAVCASAKTPAYCDKICSTDLCGFSWKLPLSAFRDLLIEQRAAFAQQTKFTGLCKGGRRTEAMPDRPCCDTGTACALKSE